MTTTPGPPGAASTSPRTLWAMAVAVALAYGLGTMLGFALTFGTVPVAALWPANVVLLAGLLLVPYSGWWLVLTLVGIVHLAAQSGAGVSLQMSCCWLFSNALEAVLGAFLARSLARELPLLSLKKMFLVMAATAVVAPFLVSFVDVALVRLMNWGDHTFWELWRRRFFSNLAATLVFLPPVLFWEPGLLARMRQAPPSRWVEGGALLIAVALLSARVIGAAARGDDADVYLYGLLSCILWAVLRFAPFGASLLLPVFASLAVIRMGMSGEVGNREVTSTQWLVIAACAPLLTLLALRQEARNALGHGARFARYPATAGLPGTPAAPVPAAPRQFAQTPPGPDTSLPEVAAQQQATPSQAMREDTLEQERQESLEHLSRVAVLGKLSAALAHELNQPLAAILSNAQAARRFLGKQPVDLQEIREILDDIVNEDRRAGEVIHKLRELFVRGELNLQILRINEVVQDVIELTRADLIERQIDFSAQLCPYNPEVRGDRVQLQQVLLNFVMNASEAIRSSRSTRGRLEISTRSHAESVTLTVTDDGPGIAPELMQKVFDAFFTTKKHGMGFGLSISNTIVHQHGGRIDAANRPEGGAVFTVVLPRHKEIRKDF